MNLVITDYCMPGMTGYDLLKKIKVEFMLVHQVSSLHILSSIHLFQEAEEGLLLL